MANLATRWASSTSNKNLAAYFSSLQARGADVLSLGVAGDHGLDALDIRIPSSASSTLGVRDVVTKARTLATDIAYRCHDDSLISFYMPRGIELFAVRRGEG